MKKFFAVFTAVIWMASSLSLSVFAYDDCLVDEADLLTATEEQQLLEHITVLQDTYDVDVILYTTNDLQGNTARQAADMFYDNGSYREDALLLLISPNERHILTNGLCFDAVDDAMFDRMVDAILPCLELELYYEACEVFVTLSDEALEPYAPLTGIDCLVIALICGAVIGLITVLVLRAQLKSVRPQAAANDYIRKGSFVLTRESELYLYSTVSRVAKPKNNSSSSRSSGGGSRGGRSF